jgi:cell division cycle protein 20 (cofactor of APC complex)
LLSSGSFDSHIHTNDIRASPSQSLVSTFFGHRQEVCGLKWSPDGQQLASGGNDNLLCIWDINTRMRGGIFQQNQYQPNVVTSPKYCFAEHKAAVKALAWCPWQRHLLASGGGSRDQTIKFWNTDAGGLVQSIQTESQVCALQWNPYDREILSSHGFVNNQLCIWKYPQMKKIADLRGHTSRVLHLALSPDGTTVASAAADETLRFWKVFEPSQSALRKKLPLPRCAAPTRDSENGSGTHNGSPSDIVMSDYTQFFQASPSQFNGFSLR